MPQNDLLECADWLRRLADEQRSFADTLYGGGTVAKALQTNCLLSAKRYERWADAVEHSNVAAPSTINPPTGSWSEQTEALRASGEVVEELK